MLLMLKHAKPPYFRKKGFALGFGNDLLKRSPSSYLDFGRPHL